VFHLQVRRDTCYFKTKHYLCLCLLKSIRKTQDVSCIQQSLNVRNVRNFKFFYPSFCIDERILSEGEFKMRIVLRASVTTLPTEKVWLHEEFPKDWKLRYSYLQHISTGTDITFLLPRFVFPQIYFALSLFLSLSCYKHFLPGTSPLEPTVFLPTEASIYILQYLPYCVWCSKYS